MKNRFSTVVWLALLGLMVAMGILAEEKAKGDPPPPPTFTDVKYGEHERHVLDFWKAESATPTPLLICFHGGGFTGGDKSHYHNDPRVKRCLDHGISVATANYRFVSQAPFPGAMADGARVVQFLRAHAGEWNIDPTRVAITGGSAGGNMGVWIALHDEMADPKSEDPISRQSTRITCVLGFETQTFNDPFMIVQYIGGNPSVHPAVLRGYGVKTMEELKTPEKQEIIKQASAINFVSADDPPIYLSYGSRMSATPMPPTAPEVLSIHHPKFGQMLKEKLDAVGVECIFRYSGDEQQSETPDDFLYRCLKVKP